MPGQADVAMSRVKSFFSGLYLLGFDASAIHINPAVQKEMVHLKEILVSLCDTHFVSNADAECLSVNLLNISS